MEKYIKKKAREYYRYCQICGERNNQRDMVRLYDQSVNWICQSCYDREYGILNDIDEF